MMITYPESLYFEVKAVKGTVTLSHSRHQVRGLIDVAAGSPAAFATSTRALRPILTFITTGNTRIGADVIAEATKRGVALWQAVVMEDLGTSPMNPVLSIGPFVPLNRMVYPPGTTLNTITAPPRTGPLVSSVITLIVDPSDPDPPEVEE
ncbi:MAG TPA: hypothetical protein VK539_03790 [Myxococcaceae bacterium]|nr:hypothetical protein [Myxococcaceae bacterium]